MWPTSRDGSPARLGLPRGPRVDARRWPFREPRATPERYESYRVRFGTDRDMDVLLGRDATRDLPVSARDCAVRRVAPCAGLAILRMPALLITIRYGSWTDLRLASRRPSRHFSKLPGSHVVSGSSKSRLTYAPTFLNTLVKPIPWPEKIRI
jgi:hypothetical protein